MRAVRVAIYCAYMNKMLNNFQYLFSISGGLVQRLKPHVAQRQHRVGVVLG